MDARLQWFREGLEGLSAQELKDMLVEEHAKRMQEHEERIREHEERMRENMRLLTVLGAIPKKQMSSLKALMTPMKIPWLKNICRRLKAGPPRR